MFWLSTLPSSAPPSVLAAFAAVAILGCIPNAKMIAVALTLLFISTCDHAVTGENCCWIKRRKANPIVWRVV
jgi:hypothetical protein